MNKKNYWNSLLLMSLFSVSLYAQMPSKLDFHTGFGFGLTVSGLPSQISNEVAKKEQYIEKTENEKGFPFGTSFFAGLGYRPTKSFSFGLEYGFGYNLDIGRADVKIGQVVPDYVLSAFDELLYQGYTKDEIDIMKTGAESIYPGMTVKNNLIKGSYFDHKFLLYLKYNTNFREVPVGLQFGTGLKILHAQDYYAIQSKKPEDYITKDGVPLDNYFFWPLSAVWASKPVKIPFPLKTKGDEVFMKQTQMLADISIRMNIHMFYIDLDYATEFRRIHNTKITLGVMLDANILDSLLKSKI